MGVQHVAVFVAVFVAMVGCGGASSFPDSGTKVVVLDGGACDFVEFGHLNSSKAPACATVTGSCFGYEADARCPSEFSCLNGSWVARLTQCQLSYSPCAQYGYCESPGESCRQPMGFCTWVCQCDRYQPDGLHTTCQTLCPDGGTGTDGGH